MPGTYTGGMDRVRLGRVLGRGARMAARTVYDAVDAATTPSAQPPAGRSSQPVASRPRVANAVSEHTSARIPSTQDSVVRAARAAGRVQSSARAAHRGVMDPVKRASRAVSLEVTGGFFALFALSFAAAAWRFRAAPPGSHRLWVYLGFAALFGYFACSSFLRARKISRG